MKILLYGVNFYPELTGIGKYTGELAEWLVSRGHKVRVVTAPPYYPQWQVWQGYSPCLYRREKVVSLGPRIPLTCEGLGTPEAMSDLKIYRCPLWVPSNPSGLKRILHLFSFAISSLPVMLLQIFKRPDVVLVIEPPLLCAPAAVFTAFLARAKAILHVQDFEVDAAFDMGLLRSSLVRQAITCVERWLMRRFDLVSTISDCMMKQLSDKGVEASRRIFFPNWVDTDLIHPLANSSPFRKELAIDADDVVLLYSGNMGQKQGLELIIQVARQLESDTHVRFIMCGQGTSYESLRKMADGLQNVHWLPLQPLARLNDLLNLADIHLLPQRADAADLVMPSKLTGMLASGRPVIATATEGTEVWSVVEGRGINIPPGDVEQFCKAVRQLVENPQQRMHLGEQGRKYAVENLSTKVVLERFESDLLQLTGKSK